MKTLRLAGIIFSALLLTVLGMQKLSRREPSYQGRTVHQWLYEELDESKKEQAVRQVGTDAIPTLVAMVGYKEPLQVNTLNELLRKQSFIAFRFTISNSENYLGKRGFDFLGTNAISAGPQLTRLARDTNFVVRVCALSALVSIDPTKETLRQSVSEILRDSTDPEVRRSALRSLES